MTSPENPVEPDEVTPEAVAEESAAAPAGPV